MSFGSKLRNYRENKELSQEQIANLIPMNQSNYSKIERDLQEPNLYQLKRISEILEISLDILLDVKGAFVEEKVDKFFLSEVKTIYDKLFNGK